MQQTKEVLDRCRGPKIIHFRVNAGPQPKDSWVYDPAHAEGRIVGEACHFIDLFHWLTGAEPVRVSARPLGQCPSSTMLEDVTATFEFDDGSVATLLYTAEGSSLLGKERLEIFCDGTAIAMDDYRHLTIRGSQRIDAKSRRPDKGHAAELQHFADAIQGKVSPLLNYCDGIRGTVCCLRIIQSARQTAAVEISPILWMAHPE